MIIRLDKIKLQILGIGTLFFLIFLIMIPGNIGEKISNAGIIGTFMINGIWWLLLLIQALRKNPYSLEIMHWTFCLFFFFFAGMVQYLNNSYPWSVVLSDSTVLKSNVLLTVWTISVLLGQKLVNKISFTKKKYYVVHECVSFSYIVPLLTVVNAISVAYRVYEVGLVNVLARGTNTGVSFSSYESLSMLISNGLQAASYFSVVLSILSWKKEKKWINLFLIVFNLIFLVIGYFPMGIARYAIAVIYLGIILTYSDKMKTSRRFMFLFIAAFLILLPMFNSWRTVAISEASIAESMRKLLENFSSMWLANDYDAYTLYAMSIDHIAEYGVGGNHLLSILLFWVPRSLWPTKALSGSYEMAVARGLGFTNLSCPFPAEGILDGGIVGLIFFGSFIGILMQFIDKRYWKTFDLSRKEIRIGDIMYPALVIFFFFMCRGDMFYTFAYLMAYVLVWIMIAILTKKKRIKVDK